MAFKEIKDKTFENKTGLPPPKLIITYGPPASGKGYISQHELKKTLHIDPKSESTVEINIDNIVDQLPAYKSEMKDKGCIKLYDSTQFSDEIDKYKMEACKKIYSKYRSQEKVDGKTAEDLSYQLFLDAVDKNLNIIFETTGNDTTWLIPNVLENKSVKAKNYDIIIVYPVVNTQTINERAFQRAKIEGRYPTPEEINKMVENAQKNLDSLFKYVNRILIYDNNNEPILIADFQKDGDKMKGYCIADDKRDIFLNFRLKEFRDFVVKTCNDIRKTQTGGSKKFYIKYEN